MFGQQPDLPAKDNDCLILPLLILKEVREKVTHKQIMEFKQYKFPTLQLGSSSTLEKNLWSHVLSQVFQTYFFITYFHPLHHLYLSIFHI